MCDQETDLAISGRKSHHAMQQHSSESALKPRVTLEEPTNLYADQSGLPCRSAYMMTNSGMTNNGKTKNFAIPQNEKDDKLLQTLI